MTTFYHNPVPLGRGYDSKSVQALAKMIHGDTGIGLKPGKAFTIYPRPKGTGLL